MKVRPTSEVSRVLVIGTCDTKSPEIDYMVQCVRALGAEPMVMDVGVLGEAPIPTDVSKHDVAAAAGTTNAEIIALGDENHAMAATARGAGALARQLVDDGRVDGVVILGGTMGTDLALDVASVVPFGIPKVVLSTVAFSPLIPSDRVPTDLIMVLWAGGLYGLNEMSKVSIRQAVGAAVGAGRFEASDTVDRPIVAISSLGTTALRYIVDLVPALEARGFEAAVFHSTGMGGRALAQMAQQGRLAAVFDLCLQEVANDFFGSQVVSGPGRLSAPGVPRLIGPGGVDMIDAVAHQPIPSPIAGYEFHQHNRLITSAKASVDDRRRVAEHIAGLLAESDAPTAFLLPRRGVGEWDRPGGPMHEPEAIAALAEALAVHIGPPVELIDLDCHINDPLYTQTAMEVFDAWLESGVVAVPSHG